MNFKKLIPFVLIALILLACNETGDHHSTSDTDKLHVEHKSEVQKRSVAEHKKELTDAGFQIFDYVDAKTGDTILMQEYYMAFLKRGPNRSQNKEEANKLQEAHLAHLGRMYEEGYADISGPFGDDTDVRGITIYNVPNLKMADSLANLDPMVKAGRLVIEIRPWWAAKGFALR